LIGKYTNQKTNSDVAFVNIDAQTGSTAISATLPMFQGGLVLAKTRQAVHQYESSYASMDNIYRNTIVQVHTAYNSITDGISKIKADRQAVISATQSLDSTEAQFKVGTRTMVDVVNAQERLFLAQTDLAKDRYDYINSILKLKSFAGTLSPNDLRDINTWLKTSKPHQTSTDALLLNAPIKGTKLKSTNSDKKIPKTVQKR
jgi:outer membrane protein